MISRIRQLWEGRAPDDLLDMALTVPLGLAALGYYAGYQVRRAAYRWGLCRAVRPAVPVISIGNLTLGGTGKTPFTLWLADALRRRGRRPAILSRGYGRRERRRGGEALVVSDGVRLRAGVHAAGDEPFFMAASLEGVPVVVARRRRLATAAAVREFAPDVLLLDDGFQHWALDRHVNLVLWDAGIMPSATSLFPMGSLREPLGALRRADALVLTRPPSSVRCDRAGQQLERAAGRIPRWTVDFVPDGVVSLDGGSELTMPQILDTNFYAFCALARPQKFLRSLEALGITPVGWTFFGDHHWFTARDLERLTTRARARNAAALITTAKDAVRLHELADRITLPLYVLAIRTRFVPDEGEAEFLAWLESRIEDIG
ncbi:MAG: tetraacyldisaccharide 4'-kinase [Candidatus Sumerlaeia bacterium]